MLLALGVLLGELLPLKIPRRGEHEELTVSTTFAFALLLVAGLGPAVAAQSVASVIQDVVSRKPLWRIAFNLGQYAFSLGAASLVLSTTGVGGPDGAAPFVAADLPEIAVAAAVFYVVNASLVGVAVALYVEQPVGRYVRGDLGFSAVTAAVLLCLAPIVVVSLRAMPELYPLFIVLLLAVYSAGRQAARRHHEAMHDRLTGLINRQRFCEIVDERIAAREPRLAILLLDLDRFKEVNDTLGHHLRRPAAAAGRPAAAADAARPAICRAAGRRRVRGAARDAAATRDALAGARRDRRALARAVRRSTASALDGRGQHRHRARTPSTAGDADTLLQRADVAMYRAKERAAAATRSTTQRRPPTAARGSRSSRELRRAIEDGELVAALPAQDRPAHRPRRAASRRSCAGSTPSAACCRPATFIAARRAHRPDPAADAAACSTRRCAQCRDWRRPGLDLPVAVNLSTRDLLDRDLPDEVARLLAARTACRADALDARDHRERDHGRPGRAPARC